MKWSNSQLTYYTAEKETFKISIRPHWSRLLVLCALYGFLGLISWSAKRPLPVLVYLILGGFSLLPLLEDVSAFIPVTVLKKGEIRGIVMTRRFDTGRSFVYVRGGRFSEIGIAYFEGKKLHRRRLKWSVSQYVAFKSVGRELANWLNVSFKELS